jgi:hypothetical protein
MLVLKQAIKITLIRLRRNKMTHMYQPLFNDPVVDVARWNVVRETAWEWPWYYIDPDTRTDAAHSGMPCEDLPEDEVPTAIKPSGEFINKLGLTDHYEGTDHHGAAVVLDSVKKLAAVKWPI